eukprot:COSAG05_NODE_9844_length_598_cov_0.695391_1_plen_76_part_00
MGGLGDALAIRTHAGLDSKGLSLLHEGRSNSIILLVEVLSDSIVDSESCSLSCATIVARQSAANLFIEVSCCPKF